MGSQNGYEILALNTDTWDVLYQIPIGEPIRAAQGYEQGVMRISADGRELFFTTSEGVRMYDVPSLAIIDSMTVTGFASPTVAGTLGSFAVTLYTSAGLIDTGYSGTIHLSTSDPQAQPPLGDYTFTPSTDHGRHTFSVAFHTVPVQSISAADLQYANVTGRQTGIAVLPAAANHFAVSAPPTSEAGKAFSATLTARDPFNNVDSNFRGTVTWTTDDPNPTVTLPGPYTFLAADNGVHAFPNGFILKTVISRTITAITAAASGGTSVGIIPAAANHFNLDAPAVSAAGAPFSVTVTAQDAFGNVDTNFTGTVIFSPNDPHAPITLPASYTFVAADSGRHTFSNGFVLKTAGTQTITASASAGNGIASVQITPAPANHFSVANMPASSQAGSAFSATVTALDPFNNVDINYTGTMSFSTSDPFTPVTLPTPYTFVTAEKGVHTFSNGLILKTAGMQSITARAAAGSGSGRLEITPMGANHLLLTAPVSSQAGTAFSATVTALDAFNNVDPTFLGTVSFSTTDSRPAVRVPPPYTFTKGPGLDNGTHTFNSGFILATALLPQTLTATAGSITGSAILKITPLSATHLEIHPPVTIPENPPFAPQAGAPFTLEVIALDPFDNLDTNYTGAASFFTSDPSATVTLPAPYTFQASDQGDHIFTNGYILKTAPQQSIVANAGSVRGSLIVPITPAPADHFTVAAPASSQAGSAFSAMVTARDPFSNMDTNFKATLTWTTSDPFVPITLPGAYTFTSGVGGDNGQHSFTNGFVLKTAGTQSVTANMSSGSGKWSVFISPAPVDHFQVKAPSSILAAGMSSFPLMAQDPFNNRVTTYAGTVRFTTGDPRPFVLPADSMLSTGIGTFSAMFRLAGAQTLTATDVDHPTLTGTAKFTVGAARTPIILFVTQAYFDLLLRAPDDGGLAYWTNRIATGTPRRQIATELTHSDEYYTTIIVPAYQQFLGRTPDAGGLSYWVAQMRAGLTDEQLQAGFIGSPEYYTHSGRTDKAWIDAMYVNLLGRPKGPTPDEENYWLKQLSMGANRSAVAYGFAASAEEEGIRVQGDYQKFLLRAANQPEVDFWVNLFKQAVRNEDVVAGFVGSDEYFRRSTGG